MRTSFAARLISPPRRDAMRTVAVVLGVAIFASAAMAAPSHATPQIGAQSLDGTIWQRIGQKYGIDPFVLYAIAIMESGTVRRNGAEAPWPWTICENTAASIKGLTLASEPEARRLIERSPNLGALDVGLMQLNLRWNTDGTRAAAYRLLDPATNVELAARLLQADLRSAPGDLTLGIGRYHDWRPQLARAYGQTVLRIYANLLGQAFRRRNAP